jgi:hypothetical protein
MVNLNKIIRKVVNEQFFSFINEQDEQQTNPADESNVNDFIVEVTSTGGGMMIPKSSKPEILERIDKSVFKSKLDTTEKILDFVKNKPYVSLICQKYYDDLDFNSCASLYVQKLFR